jgi:hypothetical protein
MDSIYKALSGLAKLQSWLQLSWFLWLVAGVILAFITANKFKGQHEEHVENPPSPATSPLPAPTSTPNETINVNVGGVTIIVNVVTVEAHDNQGKNAKFEISILSRECYWQCRSATTVLLNKEPVDMLAFFSSSGMQARLNRVQDLIAIGAASEEGSVEREGFRADARANQLIHWLRQTVMKESVTFWTLSVGKLKGEGAQCGEESDLNRSIVIVGVVEKDDGINLKEAIWNQLEGNEAMPFEVARYYKFELKKVGQSVNQASK